MSAAATALLCACSFEPGGLIEAPSGDASAPDAPSASLANDRLVVRYFLDDASSGTGVSEARDSAPDPMDLALDYGDRANLAFVEMDGQRGLEWQAAASDGMALAPVGTLDEPSKVRALVSGSRQATWELALEVFEVVLGANGPSRIVAIGEGTEAGRLTLRAGFGGTLSLTINNMERALWPIDWDELGRVVVHVVIDSEEEEEEDRARLYVNGELVAPSSTTLSQDTAIDLEDGRYLVLGNREPGARSFRGRMFYAALYAGALKPEQVSHNAQRLMLDDDGP
jgi:hypothetical protein